MSTSGGSGGSGTALISAAGDPAAATPAAIGQLYVDTTNGALYLGMATTAGAWVQLGGHNPTFGKFVGVESQANTTDGASLMATASDYIVSSAGNAGLNAAPSAAAQLAGTAFELFTPVNTAFLAAVSAPSISTGVKFTPSTVGDGFLSFYCSHAGTLTVTMGPSTGTENTMLSAVAVLADGQFDFWVPAGWGVIVTLAGSAAISNVKFVLI